MVGLSLLQPRRRVCGNNAPIPYIATSVRKRIVSVKRVLASLLFPYIFLRFGCRNSGVGVDCRLCLSVVFVNCWLSVVECLLEIIGQGVTKRCRLPWLTNRQ